MNQLKLLILAIFILPFIMAAGLGYITQTVSNVMLRGVRRFFDWSITE